MTQATPIPDRPTIAHRSTTMPQTRLTRAEGDALAAASWSCQRDAAYLAAMADRFAALVARDDDAFALAELRAWVALFAARAADLAAFAAGLPAGLLRDRAIAAAKSAATQHTRKAAALAKKTAHVASAA